MKQKIQSALQSFSKGNLTENALNLFQTLGYNTERQSPLNKPTFAAFKASFIDNQSTFNEEKAKVGDWKYVDLLFQLSKEEILRQMSRFDTKQVDRTIIETYLFFVIELANEHYSRTALSHITREVNRLFPMPVMILFKHGSLLTLSVINRRLHKRDDSKDVLEKVTLIKDIRISPAGGGVRRTGMEIPLKKEGQGVVSLNKGGDGVITHRAHIEILFDLSFDELKNERGFTNFVELHNAWQKALDASELNKRFFRELANWYFWAMDNVEFPDDLEKKTDVRNATNLIRLITRLVFIWFIKEKDLLPDLLFRKNYLNTILNGFNKDNSSNVYYHAILQNLFFGTLNQKMGERGFAREGSFPENKNEYGVKNLFRYADKFSIKEEEVVELFKDIPFLNGGLFDCLDKPNDEGKVVYVDGFSRNPQKQANVPDFLFFSDELEVDLNEIFGTKNKKYKVKGLINLLDSYKFTVAENTPIEEEIALDPELLGKVFENLLASYNPETQTTARKQTGSFYTPREIVNYMVDESLIAYLISTVSTASIPAGGNDYNYPFFNPHDEIKIHQGNLPHWQQEDVFYFVTFRLADSIPKEKVEQLRQERETWLKNHPKNKEGKYSTEELKEYYRLFSKRVEEWLDKGAGGCILREQRYAKIVADALLYFNKEKYILDEWVLMPNHIHILVKPINNYSLTEILHSWKSYTANEINKLSGNKGQLWMHESYDHIVRNREAFEAIRNYIRQNPAKAGIALPDCAKSWTESTANIPDSTTSILAGGNDPADKTIRSKDAPDTEVRLRKLLSYSDEPHDFTEGETKLIISAIDTCKILDPACGSGAFPMGILHKLVHILHKLDPRNELWKQRQIDKALQIDDPNIRDHATQDIEEAFENNELDYGRKLYLIENCIYGVDIQPIAVQIAKLRFFISLIIDQKKQADKDNFGIRSLPNLETKFVSANTLIGLNKPAGQFALKNLKIKALEETLKQLRHDYFSAKTREEKLQYQKQDKVIRQQIAKLLENDRWDTKTAQQIIQFDPYDQNATASFFDSEWMFGVKEGFDVVIANPPYGADLKDTLEKMEAIYQYYDRQKNSASFFIELASRLVKNNGVVTYIVPKSLSFSEGWQKTRKLIADKYRLLTLVDVSKAFDAVLLEQIIISFIKSKSNSYEFNTGDGWNSTINSIGTVSNSLIKEHDTLPVYIDKAKLRILEKISKQSILLSKISHTFRGLPLQRNISEEGLPILRGKNIGKYKIYGKIDKISLPQELMSSNKIKDILIPKIISQNIVAHVINPYDRIIIMATLDKEPFLTLDTVMNTIITDDRFAIEYVISILNSPLASWFYYWFVYNRSIRTMHFDKYYIGKLPIKNVPLSNQKPFINLVDQIFATKQKDPQADTLELERQIDVMVYKLYELTHEEVKIIEPEFAMSAVEYESFDVK